MAAAEFDIGLRTEIALDTEAYNINVQFELIA